MYINIVCCQFDDLFLSTGEACHEQESKEPGPHITGHIVPTTPTVLGK